MTKTKGAFPCDMALIKLIYLATENISKKMDTTPSELGIDSSATLHEILGRYNLTCNFYEEILIMDVARPYDRRIALKDLFADFDFNPNWDKAYRRSIEL